MTGKFCSVGLKAANVGGIKHFASVANIQPTRLLARCRYAVYNTAVYVITKLLSMNKKYKKRFDHIYIDQIKPNLMSF